MSTIPGVHKHASDSQIVTRPNSIDVRRVDVRLLQSAPPGGFSEFASRYPHHCEGSNATDAADSPPASLSNPMMSGALKRQACAGSRPGVTSMSPRYEQKSLSQPCLPLSSAGPTNILPYLYLGSQQDANDVEMLKKKGIRYVVNLSVNIPRCEHISKKHFLRIRVNDSHMEKLRPHFEKAFDFIDKVREAESAVLVHCLAGISRSPTLAIAYIMKTLNMNSDQAYTYVKSKRTNISPNFNFLGQLLEYEEELRANRSKQAHQRLKQSMKRAPPPMASKAAHVKSAGGQTTLATLMAAAKSRGHCIDALSDTETVAQVVVARESKPRPPSTSQIGASVGDDFYYTDDDEPVYMRRSLSCPIKMHKSNSETRLSIRRPPEFDNLEEEPEIVNEADVKRGRPVMDEPPVANICRSGSTPTNLTAARPFTLSRPGENIFTRVRNRMLRIPTSVKEDLPSPSTDFNNRLSFTDPPVASEGTSAVNPFFTDASICRPSLCSSRLMPSLCGPPDAVSPANVVRPSFADAIVDRQPSSSMDVVDECVAENPTFRHSDKATFDAVRESTTSTDSGVSAGMASSVRLEALFRQRRAIDDSVLRNVSMPQSGQPMEVETLPYKREAERDSMHGSSSSLEIAVNS